MCTSRAEVGCFPPPDEPGGRCLARPTPGAGRGLCLAGGHRVGGQLDPPVSCSAAAAPLPCPAHFARVPAINLQLSGGAEPPSALYERPAGETARGKVPGIEKGLCAAGVSAARRGKTVVENDKLGMMDTQS